MDSKHMLVTREVIQDFVKKHPQEIRAPVDGEQNPRDRWNIKELCGYFAVMRALRLVDATDKDVIEEYQRQGCQYGEVISTFYQMYKSQNL
jgi:hypothetical protein